MLIKENVVVEIPQVKEKVCDKCGYTAKSDNFIEWQEFVSLDLVGGYGSVFGDGCHLTLDLCQHCFKELLEPYVKYTDDENYDEDDKY